MKTILIALCSLLLTGCVTVQVDPTKAARESVIPEGFSLAQVRPTLKLATSEDTVKQMGNTFNVQSGKIFRQVFVGGDDAPYVLDAVNLQLSQNLGDFMVLASSTSVTYSASVLLTGPDGRKQTLNAMGTAKTMWTLDRAIREAIERAVIDLAHQINALSTPPPQSGLSAK